MTEPGIFSDIPPHDEHLLIAGALGELRELVANDEITSGGLLRLRRRLRSGEHLVRGMPPSLGVERGVILDWCCRRLIEHGVGDATYFAADLISPAPDDASALDEAT